MKLKDLSKAQLRELKENFLVWSHPNLENLSYEDFLNVETVVSDEEMEKEYGNTIFSSDNFICSRDVKRNFGVGRGTVIFTGYDKTHHVFEFDLYRGDADDDDDVLDSCDVWGDRVFDEHIDHDYDETYDENWNIAPSIDKKEFAKAKSLAIAYFQRVHKRMNVAG